MKKIVIYLSLCLWIIACANKDKSSTPATEKSDQISGAKIYLQNCVLCHGEDGKLGLNGSKDLTKTELSMEERIAIISNGRGTMVGFKSLLNEAKIQAVAEYTAQLVKE